MRKVATLKIKDQTHQNCFFDFYFQSNTQMTINMSWYWQDWMQWLTWHVMCTPDLKTDLLPVTFSNHNRLSFLSMVFSAYVCLWDSFGQGSLAGDLGVVKVETSSAGDVTSKVLQEERIGTINSWKWKESIGKIYWLLGQLNSILHLTDPGDSSFWIFPKTSPHLLSSPSALSWVGNLT